MKGSLALIFAVGVTHAIAAESGLTADTSIGAIDPVVERRLGELLLSDALRVYIPSTDQAQISLVNEIGYRILRAIDDSVFVDDWQFIVINSEKTNAYSLPGGKIFIFSGLLRSITSEGKIDTGMLAAEPVVHFAELGFGEAFPLQLLNENILNRSKTFVELSRIIGTR